MLRYLEMTCLLLVALWTAGCSGSDSPVVPAAGGVVNLCIAVSTNDSQPLSPVSRAIPNDTVCFEPSMSDYELINTLRIIIANKDGVVELNEFYGPLKNVVSKITDIIFTTKEFGKRDIYLIANEASVPSSAFNFKIMPGDKVDPSILDIKLETSAAGSPLIDNTGDEKHFIPMAEHFEVDIQAPPIDYEGDYWQYANLFVTRGASKFSFSIKATEPPLVGNSYKITKVVFNSIGNMEYLFPTNTVYNPAKYFSSVTDAPLNTESMPGRIILSYDVPTGAANVPLTFDIPSDKLFFDSNTKDAQVYSPEQYFPETILNGDYIITLIVDFDGVPDYGNDGEQLPSTREFTAKLPNLPNLPRNTHVVIKAEFDAQSLNAVVDLVPYIGVNLEPEFGFDDLYPKPSEE